MVGSEWILRVVFASVQCQRPKSRCWALAGMIARLLLTPRTRSAILSKIRPFVKRDARGLPHFRNGYGLSWPAVRWDQWEFFELHFCPCAFQGQRSVYRLFALTEPYWAWASIVLANLRNTFHALFLIFWVEIANQSWWTRSPKHWGWGPASCLIVMFSMRGSCEITEFISKIYNYYLVKDYPSPPVTLLRSLFAFSEFIR